MGLLLETLVTYCGNHYLDLFSLSCASLAAMASASRASQRAAKHAPSMLATPLAECSQHTEGVGDGAMSDPKSWLAGLQWKRRSLRHRMTRNWIRQLPWMQALRQSEAAPPLPVLESICLGFPALEAAPRTQSGDSDVVWGPLEWTGDWTPFRPVPQLSRCWQAFRRASGLRRPRRSWYVSPLVCRSGGPACCAASPAPRGLGQCSPTATYSGRQDLLTASVSVVWEQVSKFVFLE